MEARKILYEWCDQNDLATYDALNLIITTSKSVGRLQSAQGENSLSTKFFLYLLTEKKEFELSIDETQSYDEHCRLNSFAAKRKQVTISFIKKWKERRDLPSVEESLYVVEKPKNKIPLNGKKLFGRFEKSTNHLLEYLFQKKNLSSQNEDVLDAEGVKLLEVNNLFSEKLSGDKRNIQNFRITQKKLLFRMASLLNIMLNAEDPVGDFKKIQKNFNL